MIAIDFPATMPSAWDFPSPESGVGVEIHRKLSEMAADFRNTWTHGEHWNTAMSDLTDVAKECCHPNWDGYGAPAISPDTFRQAASFIESIPSDIPQPEIGASSDGDVTFEWAQSPYRVVSVGISSSGGLHFASLNGQKRCFGSMPFDGAFDSRLYSLIWEVLA
ncbi:MAG: hypothetical protein NTZ46_11380 [Verrucomicrobia bacterium]|nr:hypothetical protein [Verrucomicrobiota bacterium]